MSEPHAVPLDDLYGLVLREDYRPPVDLRKPLTLAQSIRAAITKMRDEPAWPPPCGSAEHPHLFHPRQIGRVIWTPTREQMNGATEWAFCANMCGGAWPLAEVEREP